MSSAADLTARIRQIAGRAQQRPRPLAAKSPPQPASWISGDRFKSAADPRCKRG